MQRIRNCQKKIKYEDTYDEQLVPFQFTYLTKKHHLILDGSTIIIISKFAIHQIILHGAFNTTYRYENDKINCNVYICKVLS